MRIIIYSFILIVCCSCRQSSERLEHAFQAAGDNRAELRKVVDHYSLDPRDSLKREAAMFLIENMPGHHTLNGPYLRGLRHKVDSATNSFLLGKVILMQPLRDPRILRQLRPEPDVEHITAEYLIHNIDEAFRQWTTLARKTHVRRLPRIPSSLPHRERAARLLERLASSTTKRTPAGSHRVLRRSETFRVQHGANDPRLRSRYGRRQPSGSRNTL